MKKILDSLSQFLYPNLCISCDGFLSNQESHICELCLFTLPKFEQFEEKENQVSKKLWGRLNTSFSTAYLHLNSSSSVRKILHQIKYKGNADLGIEMGRLMGNYFKNISEFKSIDYIVPVPLHPKRENLRGYNQSELLSRGLSEVMKIPIETDLIYRSTYNSTQTKKSRFGRFVNSKAIFKVNHSMDAKKKDILLIDDVITTGATIESCGSALLEIPGLKLYVAALAVGT